MRNIVLRTFCHAAALASMLSIPVLLSAQERTAAIGSKSTVNTAADALAALEAEVNLVVFLSDTGDPAEDYELIMRNGQPVVVFTADGATALSDEDIGSVDYALLESDGISSTYALYKDGEYIDIDVITEQLDENSARLTLIDEAGNVLSEGTIVSEKPLAERGERQVKVFFAGALAWLFGAITLTVHCISRCDRCTDTCAVDRCDDAACDECFGWKCS